MGVVEVEDVWSGACFEISSRGAMALVNSVRNRPWKASSLKRSQT